MRPQFTTPASRPGVRIEDPIENAQVELYTPAPVDFEPVDDAEFYFPIDSAVRFETEKLSYPGLHAVYVRHRSGDVVAEYSPGGHPVSLPDGKYNIELTSAPVKLYVSVDGTVDITESALAVDCRFSPGATVRVGMRSVHKSPEGTITVTDDVQDVMRAVSRFGSGLKTLSAERGFPTLRGHPPLLERGDAFAAPDSITAPDSGVEILVPSERRYVYPLASLAFYLGATVRSGEAPELRTPTGTFDLTSDGSYEETVNRLLRQCVLFDCVVRTEGFYPVDLAERRGFETTTGLDPAALYDLSLAERLDRYLELPRETVDLLLPEWNLTTQIAPEPATVEMLPFIANDLSLVRTIDPPDTDPAGTSSDRVTTPSGERLVDPGPVETPEHVWVGEGYPLGANKADAAVYRRRLNRNPPEKPFIDIHVVCNDEQMTEESAVNELYGLRELIEFDVTVHYELTRAELGDLLAQDTDFLHYIGHVDRDGIKCVDGHLDARTLDAVNVKSFLLNACRSYVQGQALVDKGSYAGVVTLDDVVNSTATRVGRILARLLNAGYTIRSALTIAQGRMFTGDQYTVLGDGGTTIVQSQHGLPVSISIDPSAASESCDVTIIPYPTQRVAAGSFFSVNDALEAQHLNLGRVGPLRFDEDRLKRLFNDVFYPVTIAGELYWSDELELEALLE